MIYWDQADPYLEEMKVSTQYRRDHSYFPEVAAFDIETSRLDDVAFMYVWQFAIGDLIVYGRTWEEFRRWLQVLREVLSLTIDFRMMVYSHMQKYEFSFAHKFLIIDEKTFIARSSRDVMQAVIQGAFEWRDSYVYTEKKLEQIGNLIGIPKVKGFRYDLIRTPDTELTEEELQYCENDVKILVAFFRREVEEYGSIGKLPLTATQKVARVMSSNLYRMAGDSQRIKYRIINSQLNFNKDEDKLLLNRMRLAFFGAFNFSAPLYRDKIMDDVYNADISMCYGTQMLLHKFPRGKFTPLPLPEGVPAGSERQALIDILSGKISGYRGMAMLIRIKIKKLRAKYPALAWLPVAQKNYFGRSIELRKRMHFAHVAAADDVDLCLTDVDLRLVLMYYDVQGIEIKEIYGSRYEQLPEYILQSVATLAADKKIKGDEIAAIIASGRRPTLAEEEEYNITKSKVSRMYGVFVQDPIRQKYEYHNEGGKIQANGFINSFQDAADAKKNKQLYRPVLYQWGVWVASWARWEYINMVYRLAVDTKSKRLNNRVLYGDTDGLMFWNLPEAHNVIRSYNAAIDEKMKEFCRRYNFVYDVLSECGKFKIKHFRHFKTTGQKQYAWIDDAGRFDYHVAGLAREDWREGDDGELHNVGMKYFDQWADPMDKMKQFVRDMEISADISNNLRAFYHDEPVTLHDVKDYQGHITPEIFVPSGMIMKPVDFKMKSDTAARISNALDDRDRLAEYCHKNGIEMEESE